MLHLVPCRLSEAQEFVTNFHRHNKAPRGGIFSVGLSDGTGLVGVAIVGRPVARLFDDGLTVEVTRVCVKDGIVQSNSGHKGTGSILYAACWRAAKALGYTRLVTYTLKSESGASLRGAGYKVIADLGHGRPQDWVNRPGREWQTVVGQAKLLWEKRT